MNELPVPCLLILFFQRTFFFIFTCIYLQFLDFFEPPVPDSDILFTKPYIFQVCCNDLSSHASVNVRSEFRNLRLLIFDET